MRDGLNAAFHVSSGISRRDSKTADGPAFGPIHYQCRRVSCQFMAMLRSHRRFVRGCLLGSSALLALGGLGETARSQVALPQLTVTAAKHKPKPKPRAAPRTGGRRAGNANAPATPAQ